MPLRSLAFLFYFMGSSSAALLWPMAGLVCYVVLYHVYPQTTWWGAALEPLSLRYTFICGLCLVVGTILSAGRTRIGRPAIHSIEVGAVAVFAAMLLTLVTGKGQSTQTMMLIDKMLKVIVFLLVMSHVLVSRKRLWVLVVVLTLSTLYLGHEARNAPPGAFMKNRLDGIGGPDFRESAGLAIHLCALLPFVAVTLHCRKWWLRLVAFLAAGYGINAVLLCRARSAFLASVVAGLAALVYAPRRHRRWIAVSLCAGAIGVGVLSDSWFWKRMDTIIVDEQERDMSAATRLIIWAAAWDMFVENPLGVGVGRFDHEIRKYTDKLQNVRRDAHNSFVLCAGEIGVLGLGAYLVTLALAWATLGRASRMTRQLVDRDLFEWIILANRLALIVYIVSGLFVSRFYTEGMWWLMILPVCLTRAIKVEIRQEQQVFAKVAQEADEPLLGGQLAMG